MAVRTTAASSQYFYRGALHAGDLDTRSGFTVCFWFMHRSSQSGNAALINFGQFPDSATINAYLLNNVASIEEVNTGSDAGTTLTTDAWYHIGITFNPATDALNLYVRPYDGAHALDASVTATGPGFATSSIHMATYGGFFDYADGRWQDLKVWQGRILTTGELDTEAVTLKSVASTTNLWCHLPMDAGAGRLDDASANNRDFTASGTLTDEADVPSFGGGPITATAAQTIPNFISDALGGPVTPITATAAQTVANFTSSATAYVPSGEIPPKVKIAGINVGPLGIQNPGNDALKNLMLRAEGPYVQNVGLQGSRESIGDYRTYCRYDRYPKSLPPGKEWVWRFPYIGTTNWVAIWEGEGTVVFNWPTGVSSGSASLSVSGTTFSTSNILQDATWTGRITSTNPANPVRNLDLVRVEDVSSYKTTPWRSQYLLLNDRASIYRLMEAMQCPFSRMGHYGPHLMVELEAIPQGSRSFGDALTIYPWRTAAGALAAPTLGSTMVGQTSGISGVVRAWSSYWEANPDPPVIVNWVAVEVAHSPDGTSPAGLFLPGEPVVVNGTVLGTIRNTSGAVLPFDPSSNMLGYGTNYDYLSYSGYGYLPAPIVAALANQTGADLWLSMYVAASPTFVSTYLTAIFNALRDRRPLYLEWGNEAFFDWNDGYHHAQGLAQVRGHGSRLRAIMEETATLIDAARTIFGATGVVGVLQGETYGATTGYDSFYGLTYQGNTLSSRISALAIAPYYGTVHSFTSSATIAGVSTSTNIPAAEAAIDGWKTKADEQGKRLVAYEGGNHWDSDGTTAVRNATSDYVRNVIRNNITDLLSRWSSSSANDLFCLYTEVLDNGGTYSPDQFWGLGRSLTDTGTSYWLGWRDYQNVVLPGTPTLTITGTTATTVSLSATATDYAAGRTMTIYRGSSEDGPWNLLTTLAHPTTTHVDTVAANTAYWYKVYQETATARSTPSLVVGGPARITNLTGTTTFGAPCSVALHCTDSVFGSGGWPACSMLWDMGDGTQREGFTIHHVYETPGVYVVTLNLINSDNVEGSASLTITVNSYTPATIYYVSGTGNDTTGDGTIGNPYRTLQRACAVQTGTGANKGIYLERGYTYTLALLGQGFENQRTVLPFDYGGTATQPFIIRAYGSGTDPIVYAPDSGPSNGFSVFPCVFQIHDWWRLIEIDFRGPYVWGTTGGDFEFGSVVSYRFDHGMFLRCTLRGWGIAIGMSMEAGIGPRGTCVKDSIITDNYLHNNYSENTIGFSYLNTQVLRVWDSHSTRLPMAQYYYGNGNLMKDGSVTRTVIKFHAQAGLGTPCNWIWIDGDTFYTKSESNNVVMEPASEGESDKEYLSNFCVQNCQFLTDSTNVGFGNKHCISTNARTVVIRNNRINLDSTVAGFTIIVRVPPHAYTDTTVNPRDIYILNNSVYSRGVGQSLFSLLHLGRVAPPPPPPIGPWRDFWTNAENVVVENNAVELAGSYLFSGVVSRGTDVTTSTQLNEVQERNNIGNLPTSMWGWQTNFTTYSLGGSWNSLPGLPKGSGSVAGLPGFVDALNRNWTITTASAAYRAALGDIRVWKDHRGAARLSLLGETRVDAGAYHIETSRVPTNLTATTGGYNWINLSWTDNSGNESGFVVERAPDAGGLPGTFDEIRTAPSGSTSIADTDLEPATTYHYRLRPRTPKVKALSTSASATGSSGGNITTIQVGTLGLLSLQTATTTQTSSAVQVGSRSLTSGVGTATFGEPGVTIQVSPRPMVASAQGVGLTTETVTQVVAQGVTSGVSGVQIQLPATTQVAALGLSGARGGITTSTEVSIAIPSLGLSGARGTHTLQAGSSTQISTQSLTLVRNNVDLSTTYVTQVGTQGLAAARSIPGVTGDVLVQTTARGLAGGLIGPTVSTSSTTSYTFEAVPLALTAIRFPADAGGSFTLSVSPLGLSGATGGVETAYGASQQVSALQVTSGLPSTTSSGEALAEIQARPLVGGLGTISLGLSWTSQVATQTLGGAVTVPSPDTGWTLQVSPMTLAGTVPGVTTEFNWVQEIPGLALVLSPSPASTGGGIVLEIPSLGVSGGLGTPEWRLENLTTLLPLHLNQGLGGYTTSTESVVLLQPLALDLEREEILLSIQVFNWDIVPMPIRADVYIFLPEMSGAVSWTITAYAGPTP